MKPSTSPPIPTTTLSSPALPSTHSAFPTPTSRYTALQTRDPASHSSFIYAVLTTRICCRPTCPARLARRANVVFYDTYAEAVVEGFRACKRCRPDLKPGDEEEAAVDGGRGRRGVGRAVGLIMEREGGAVGAGVGTGEAGVGDRDGGDSGCGKREGKRLGLEELAREAGLTKSHFHRLFKQVTGVTPRVFAGNVRAERMLREGASAISSTAMTGMTKPEMMEIAKLSSPAIDGLSTPGSIQNESNDMGVVGKDLNGMDFQDFWSDIAFETSLSHLDPGITETMMNDNDAFTKKIEYTIQPWASGFVLIAATSDGICWLEAGNSPAELELSLTTEFSHAEKEVSSWIMGAKIDGDETGKYEMFETVMEALIRPTGKVLDVPFDIA